MTDKLPKVAVCISGQPRSFEKGFEYLNKNMLSRTDIECEVYIHTWYYDWVNYNEMAKLYKPKRMIVDTPWLEDDPNVKSYTNIVSFDHPALFTLAAFHSIHQAHCATPGSVTADSDYDWEVRTRFDFALNAPIDFSALETNRLYVPNCRMTPDRDFCNDQFAFGDPMVMGAYSSTRLYIPGYYKEGVRMNGEDMLAAHLKHSLLTGDQMVYVDMKHPFPPGQYNSTWHSLIRDDYHLWKP